MLIDELMIQKGLKKADLAEADCFYVHDDEQTIVAEYPKTWQHSRLSPKHKSRSIGASSMYDGRRALIVLF
jgi:hypothetical protein